MPKRKQPFRKLEQCLVWTSLLTCRKCSRKERVWHHGVKNKESARRDLPSAGWNGWDFKKKICPVCVSLPKTITRAEVERLQVTNSPRLLTLIINDNGRAKQHVGIGWTDIGEADGTETKLID